MSYNPNTGLAYLPTIEMPGVYPDAGMDLPKWKSPHFYAQSGVIFGSEDPPADYGRAYLPAWDPIKQKQAWKHELPAQWNAGTMTTQGNLVFEGRADGEFDAYHAVTGDTLWSVMVGSGISARPVTHAIHGRQ